MKVKLHINYNTQWGQILYVWGSSPALGSWNKDEAVRMNNESPSLWSVEFELEGDDVEYHYLVKNNDQISDEEFGNSHFIKYARGKTLDVYDVWYSPPREKFLYTSGFSECFFRHDYGQKLTYYSKTVLLNINCPYVKKDQSLILCGGSDAFGNWEPENALRFVPVKYGVWQLSIDRESVHFPVEYKIAIYDNSMHQVVHWEIGNNRVLNPLTEDEQANTVYVENIEYWYDWMNWKAAGVAIPIFSLRSEKSFGIGEFSDLKKMVDWATLTGQKFIQVLPINDTTNTHTWVDSYPYNAISIYALHPIYLGLEEFPLKNENLMAEYRSEARTLNTLEDVDYVSVARLKQAYLHSLFREMGRTTMRRKDYKDFYENNQEWLFPYACFSYLRDKYKTADHTKWKHYSVFDLKKLNKLVAQDKEANETVGLMCFVQYLLYKQLSDAKEYAHQHNVILKGDIPIGISRYSVDAWVDPHLFNLDVQAGAPPDDFSAFGQNWGFPTYNWTEMAKDGYKWWEKRFRKMADYFDAYRIDHILGFFRIWEIPMASIQGLLGYFSPALPFTADELRARGIDFDEARMVNPFIYDGYLEKEFADYTDEVKDAFLFRTTSDTYHLKEYCNTQAKIRALFEGKEDGKSMSVRNGLYNLCNEVLFIRDKYDPQRYHPRITAQYTHSYEYLPDGEKQAFNALYDDYFFRRHNQFWREQAMQKLPRLISSTSMLVCGEDLGMVPESVPSVMRDLQILSLEVERMPKDMGRAFNNLSTLPYISVCTTSTHDMSPIRQWWHENRGLIQQYYNEILWKQGEAPEDCTPELCWQIVTNHLNSPSMLAILPLQDWLSIDGDIRRENANDERINIPSESEHYWKYRMHVTLEELINAYGLNDRIRKMISLSGRN